LSHPDLFFAGPDAILLFFAEETHRQTKQQVPHRGPSFGNCNSRDEREQIAHDRILLPSPLAKTGDFTHDQGGWLAGRSMSEMAMFQQQARARRTSIER
jgi:hypothetical protein